MSRYISVPISNILPQFILRRLLLPFLLLVGLLAVIGGIYWGYFRMTSLAVTVEIEAGDAKTITYRTQPGTVKSVLDDLNLTIDIADRVSPPLDTKIEDGMTIHIEKASQLILEVDGKAQRIYTHATNPIDILAENGIDMAPNDQLWINQRLIDQQLITSLLETPRHLKLVRPRQVTLIDNGQPIATETVNAKTVGELLSEHHVSLYLADVIIPPIDTPVFDQMVVTIKRSLPVKVEADGADFQARAVGETVGDVLNMLGLQLIGADYSIPAEDEPFAADMSIAVIRVIESIEFEQAKVPFETVQITDTTLAPNEQRVMQVGEDGLEEIRYRVRKENGLTVSRVFQTRWTVREPIPRIVAFGTGE